MHNVFGKINATKTARVKDSAWIKGINFDDRIANDINTRKSNAKFFEMG